MKVLKMMMKWRDWIGRLEDESPKFVMPNSVMFQIARDLPVSYHTNNSQESISGILDCC
jgi:ribonuclease D